jgi:antitoxin HicB
MQTMNYKIVLTPEPEGGFTVTVPDLQGCVTYGKTFEEAMRNIKEAIECHVEALQELHRPLPNIIQQIQANITVDLAFA